MKMDFILEKAKEFLLKDKSLVPALFIEVDNNIYIVGIFDDMSKVDENTMMKNMGREFAIDTRRGIGQRIKSLSFISEADVSIVNARSSIEKREAIILFSMDLQNNQKEITVQYFKRSMDDIIFEDISPAKITDRIILLESFMMGYDE